MATYTQAQIDELSAKIASGELTVRYGDKTVTYQSIDAMKALLSEMQADVAGSQATARHSLVGFSLD